MEREEYKKLRKNPGDSERIRENQKESEGIR